MSSAPDEPRVSGPYPVTEPDPRLAHALGSLWTAVTRAGGGVGYRADAPEADIRAAAERTFADVLARRQDMIVVTDDHALVGTVFLRRGDRVTIAHRAEVLRLMVRPDRQGAGWGGLLLDAAAAHAAGLGLEQLLLSCRGGTWLPEFYRRRGWTEVGRWPGALRISADDVRDEVWFQLRLR